MEVVVVVVVVVVVGGGGGVFFREVDYLKAPPKRGTFFQAGGI